MGLHYGSLGANDAAADEEQRHLLLEWRNARR